jgi:tetratricopeptide (TPR) repeat protein
MSAFPKFGVMICIAALAVSAAGCSQNVGVDPSGQAYKALDAHDYGAAREAFAAAYAKDPHDPFVELDLGVAYQNLGRMDLAEPFYRGVIADGKGIKPVTTTNPSDAGKTLDQIACTNLRLGLNTDAGC